MAARRDPAAPWAMVDRVRPRTDRRFVARVVAAARGFTGDRREIVLLCTDDVESGRLHGEYLCDSAPTDVMCFADEERIDIVVNVERARREARRRRTTIRAELALYIVHGVLHACGYDDRERRARARMRRAERSVLASLGQRFAPVDDETTSRD
jgi:probable rRNA maturation factor